MYSHHKYLLILLLALLGFSACQKEKDYYLDSGLANPYFKGSVIDYLDAQPFLFDSVSTIIDLAGMKDVLKSDTVTFFSPLDYSIRNLIVETNKSLYENGYDTIRALQEIPAAIWRKYLNLYIFHGANQLKDYPQIDFNLLINYPGQAYYSWDKQPMNIGVVYNDANGVKYVGYRQLTISFIPDASKPMDGWRTASVASCNILTDNGVVHVLSTAHSYFGFDQQRFSRDVAAALTAAGK
ncbi:hypothetical protein J2T02_004211 [Chitinophaga terrae (ex Kim and Jung 2007)]|uniref:hypothetical protein n=1 Tax=Chitinophaga terrae (ex Kim and Jung 2007) TaxID=408074 RepID=UPI0027837FA3|nr:hypothetical protein [Chitinophaga terrae (ex Kim and Jung 2007)]MDQ0109070.1 hypothetical protein [Chitinophaga terrae (ex Kim and Jung 2007)]